MFAGGAASCWTARGRSLHGLLSRRLRRLILRQCIPVAGLDGLPLKALEVLREQGPVDVVAHDVLLDYSHFSADHILKELLPAGCEVPSSFETIGHVAHLNLRDELLPYKKVIAQVLLEKNPIIRTVVNKIGVIENEFRVPQLEVLAGDPSLETEVKQHGAAFRLDYGSVYWNSRLEAEHRRLLSFFKQGQLVLDMFAGVGPFAIPAALRGCAVLANDLNPASVRYLRLNAELNRVPNAVACYERDARDFMRSTVRPPPGAAEAATAAALNGDNVTPSIDERPSDALLVATAEVGQASSGQHDYSRGCGSGSSLLDATEVRGDSSDGARPTSIGVSSKAIDESKASTAGPQVESQHVGGRRRTVTVERKQQQLPVAASTRPWEHFDHAIMNLPASALEFLDVFNGLLSTSCWRGELPMIHCYCFARSHETQADVVKRAESHLGGKISFPTIHTVRDVAPNKIMLCLSFRLSPEVAFAQAQDEQPNGKLGFWLHPPLDDPPTGDPDGRAIVNSLAQGLWLR
eukprot:SM000132S26891  [mRNA]  locus=s132:280597:283951:- [translate_table: standard]